MEFDRLTKERLLAEIAKRMRVRNGSGQPTGLRAASRRFRYGGDGPVCRACKRHGVEATNDSWLGQDSAGPRLASNCVENKPIASRPFVLILLRYVTFTPSKCLSGDNLIDMNRL